MCGEKGFRQNEKQCRRGSPPRVRGKAFDAGKLIPFYGITPACAGKSSALCVCQDRVEDHPRVCGEKQIPKTYISRSRGSPPRVRGKASPYVAIWFSSGITPACAGKSSLPIQRWGHSQDHPRVCGEKVDGITST